MERREDLLQMFCRRVWSLLQWLPSQSKGDCLRKTGMSVAVNPMWSIEHRVMVKKNLRVVRWVLWFSQRLHQCLSKISSLLLYRCQLVGQRKPFSHSRLQVNQSLIDDPKIQFATPKSTLPTFLASTSENTNFPSLVTATSYTALKEGDLFFTISVKDASLQSTS